MLQVQPHFDFTALDLITDRYALVSLLEHASGPKGFFTFGAQVVGGTVVFIRTDPARRRVIKGFSGFRDDFGKRYLEFDEGLKGTLSHYRIITCELGQLRIMLRHAADGYLPDSADEVESSMSDKFGSEGEEQKADGFAIQCGGTFVPRSSVLEFNTCNKDSSEAPRIKRKFREAWLSQNLHFAIAKYSITEETKEFKDTKNYLNCRTRFYKENMTFYDESGIMVNSGIENQNLVNAFYGILEKLVRDICAAAANGQGDKFIVEHVKAADDVTITPNKEIIGLSTELCDRMKMGCCGEIQNDDEEWLIEF